MAKNTVEGERRKAQIKTYYRNRYYSLWMDSRKWNGLSYSQSYYLMKQLYQNGTVLVFNADADRLPSEKGYEATSSEIQGDQTLVITPYACSDFNTYGQPTKPVPINVKGIKIIPTKQLDATNSVVLWAHTSHKSIAYLVDYWIDQIVDVQIALDMNIYVQRVPKLFTVSPTDERRVQEIANKIDAGVRQIFITADDWQAIQQVMDSGQNYILDKLLKYRQSLESEVLNLLGINSIQYEKSERITDEEATANDTAIDLYGSSITDSLDQGCKMIREVLGYNITVTNNFQKPDLQNQDQTDERGDNYEEN